MAVSEAAGEEFDYVIVGSGAAGSVLAQPADRGARRDGLRAGGRPT